MNTIKDLMSCNSIRKTVGIRAYALLFFCFVISGYSHAIEQYGLPIADYPQKGITYHVTTSLKQTRTQETIRRGKSSLKTKTQGMIFDGNLTWENVGLDKDVELRMTVHKFMEFDDDGTHSLFASNAQIIRKRMSGDVKSFIGNNQLEDKLDSSLCYLLESQGEYLISGLPINVEKVSGIFGYDQKRYVGETWKLRTDLLQAEMRKSKVNIPFKDADVDSTLTLEKAFEINGMKYLQTGINILLKNAFYIVGPAVKEKGYQVDGAELQMKSRGQEPVDSTKGMRKSISNTRKEWTALNKSDGTRIHYTFTEHVDNRVEMINKSI